MNIFSCLLRAAAPSPSLPPWLLACESVHVRKVSRGQQSVQRSGGDRSTSRRTVRRRPAAHSIPHHTAAAQSMRSIPSTVPSIDRNRLRRAVSVCKGGKRRRAAVATRRQRTDLWSVSEPEHRARAQGTNKARSSPRFISIMSLSVRGFSSFASIPLKSLAWPFPPCVGPLSPPLEEGRTESTHT